MRRLRAALAALDTQLSHSKLKLKCACVKTHRACSLIGLPVCVTSASASTAAPTHTPRVANPAAVAACPRRKAREGAAAPCRGARRVCGGARAPVGAPKGFLCERPGVRSAETCARAPGAGLEGAQRLSVPRIFMFAAGAGRPARGWRFIWASHRGLEARCDSFAESHRGA